MINAKTAYWNLINEALGTGKHELQIGWMVREFERRWGFTTKTADNRIRRQVELNYHDIIGGYVKF